jgi:hypothetical protein
LADLFPPSALGNAEPPAVYVVVRVFCLVGFAIQELLEDRNRYFTTM